MPQDSRKLLHGVDDILRPLRMLSSQIQAVADQLGELEPLRDAGQAGGRPVDGLRRRGALPNTTIVLSPEAVLARSLIEERRVRDAALGAEFFGEPAWDMMLDLFAAAEEGKRVSISNLCIASAVAPTTAIRWIGTLVHQGILLRTADPSDARRVFVSLSPRATDQLRTLLKQWLAAG